MKVTLKQIESAIYVINNKTDETEMIIDFNSEDAVNVRGWKLETKEEIQCELNFTLKRNNFKVVDNKTSFIIA